MHAVDYENCVASKTCPHLAALGRTGVNYTRTTTSRPSDSFPGLMALVTGGSPRTVGAFYDVAYDRVLAPPLVTTGNGLPGTSDPANSPALAPCVSRQIYGTQTEYEEGNEFNQLLLNGGNPLAANVADGGGAAINPARLIRDPFNNCQPVYPWNFVRTNTIYGVIHAAHIPAWSDKRCLLVHRVPLEPTIPATWTITILRRSIPTRSRCRVSSQLARTLTAEPSKRAETRRLRGAIGRLISTPSKSDMTSTKVNVVNEINGKNHNATGKTPVPVIAA